MNCRLNVTTSEIIAPFKDFPLVINKGGEKFVFVIKDGEKDLSSVATTQYETFRIGFRSRVLRERNRWLAGNGFQA